MVESLGAQPLRPGLYQVHVEHYVPPNGHSPSKSSGVEEEERGVPQSTDEHHLPRNPAREAAAMETIAVTCAHHSRLQREILRIYLRTNKIMIVLLTLTAPNPRLLPLLPSPRPLSSLPFLHPLPVLLSPHFLPISTTISLFLCSFLGLSLILSLIISVCLCLSSLPVSVLSMALSLGLSSTITGGHAQGRVLSSWSLVQASPDLSSSPCSAWIDLSSP